MKTRMRLRPSNAIELSEQIARRQIMPKPLKDMK